MLCFYRDAVPISEREDAPSPSWKRYKFASDDARATPSIYVLRMYLGLDERYHLVFSEIRVKR